jgi:hypothetical protein
MPVTKDNYEELLDAGKLYYDSGAVLARGLWQLERRGATRSFVRMPGAFVTPVHLGPKGVHGAGHITELCFWADGQARSMLVEGITQEEEILTHSYAA